MSSSTTFRATTRSRVGGAVLAGIAAFGLVGASAASLGGITSSSLGADVGVVASCDTDGVTVTFTNAYDATLGRYQATGVTVGGMNAACTGKALNLTLKDAAGGSLGSLSTESGRGSIPSSRLARFGEILLTFPGQLPIGLDGECCSSSRIRAPGGAFW